MRIERQEQDWNDLATLDPYWAILTAPGKRFGGWDEGEFFASGTAAAAEMADEMERLGIRGSAGARWTSAAVWVG